ncbi:MAG: hypothetical protein OMM_05092 [Candidatus Magnetoglobus multicellularis str. Araruama]|uniref:Schlafen AlbA-2 domain-containing protein n=1 Tax=Candidatus Magnetoglobus multicellularis str. Araruama TaxID=890399 RepID=A0A1V1NY50_9BACT|nr:MAG: hypothetical protein OMM_05092 [Candidatus Magnetoglobus multicellularis str. Araruama]
MYNTVDELVQAIKAGEDSFLDFKEIRTKGNQFFFASKQKPGLELAKDLCCFANTEGGVIVFGVRDDGERIGIEQDQTDVLKRLIVNTAQNNVEPPIGHLLIFDWVMIPDSLNILKRCLKLEIKKAIHNIHAPKGKRPYWRIGDHCHEMTLDQQARLFERRGMMMPFEERPIFHQIRKKLFKANFFLNTTKRDMMSLWKRLIYHWSNFLSTLSYYQGMKQINVIPLHWDCFYSLQDLING